MRDACTATVTCMSDPRYSPWTRRLHWLIFVLVACALLLIETRGGFPRELRGGIKWAHMQFGMAVLVLMLPRLIARLRGGTPPIAPPPPGWQASMARLIHLALYALLFATPLLGIASMAWSGAPWNFLGMPLPHVPAPDRGCSHRLEDLHETLGNTLMYLAIAHAAIGLYHHYVRRDDALRRMLPPAAAED